LLLKLLEDLVAENTPQWLDFGGGDAEYKQVFGNHESQSGNVWLVPQGLRATTTHALLRGGRASSRAVRWALEKTGLRSMIRRLVRRGAVNRQATSRGRS
jgi:CelD/BcsL family acetyltransferase involved in cellulose biosynthesis